MITRYSDLAANERTYLAWIRTALALIAFGFLLERFDLMLRTFAVSFAGDKASLHLPPRIGGEAAIVMVIVGLAAMILSTARFVVTTRRIRNDSQETYGFRSVLLTGGAFILLALFVLSYVWRMMP